MRMPVKAKGGKTMGVLTLLISGLAGCVSMLAFFIAKFSARQRGISERMDDTEAFVGKHYHLLLDRVEAMERVIDKPAELEEALRRIRIEKGKQNLTT